MENITNLIKEALCNEDLKFTVSDSPLEGIHEDCIKIDVPLRDRLNASIYVVERINKLLTIEVCYSIPTDKVLATGYDEVLIKELNDAKVLFNGIFDGHHGSVFFLAEGKLDVATYIKALKQFKEPRVVEILNKIDSHLMYYYERHSLEVFALIFADAGEETIKNNVEAYKDNLIEIYGKESALIPLIDKYEELLLKGIKQEEDRNDLKAIIASFDKEIKKYKEGK